MAATSNRTKMEDIQIEIDKTKNVMKKNIEATLDRGDQLDEMEAKADRLNSQAQTFKKKTGQAKRAYCWQSWRNSIALFLIVVLLLLLILFLAGAFTPRS